MEFTLLDRIVELVPGQRLRGVKALSLGEEYLQDHFPGYPVMPGVMMLEALVQSAAWLIRASTDFSCSMAILEVAENVKYSKFLSPGQQLETVVTQTSSEGGRYRFKGEGLVEGKTVLSARFVLHYFNLGDSFPSLASSDLTLIQNLREKFKILSSRTA